ncbi:MAG: endolytic transglycosylase MltG [Clostridia bacterium]|jgi:uncharacterized membrane protein YhiD involved in acid resistance|nr:endolytic transglycosylase MltG [Clostridia bacterium]
MRGDSSKRFVFWLIGFGCGIILSGIIMIGFIFNTAEYQGQLADRVSNSEKEKNSPSAAESAADNSEINQIIDNTVNASVSDQESDEEDSKQQTDTITESALPEVKQEEKEQTITVYIPNNTNATKVCQLLEQEGVVQDGEDFLNFIIKNGKTKKLRGNIEKVFPLNGDYDVILNILISR